MAHSSHDPFSRAVQRDEIGEVVDRLLSGDISREDASLWAGRASQAVEEQGTDSLAIETLECLLGIDQIQVDAAMNMTGYLFDFDELRSLRSKFNDDEAS